MMFLCTQDFCDSKHACHDQRENGNDRRRDANRTVSADKRSSQHVRGRAMTRSAVRIVMTGGLPTEPYQLIKNHT